MSDPNRYNIAANNVQRVYGGNMLVVDPEGQLVAYVAYARLQADLTNLKSEADRLKAEVENSKRINTELLALSNRQASDIRRLTKAGDSIVYSLKWCDWGSEMQTIDAVKRWNAAKDGKPTE